MEYDVNGRPVPNEERKKKLLEEAQRYEREEASKSGEEAEEQESVEVSNEEVIEESVVTPEEPVVPQEPVVSEEPQSVEKKEDTPNFKKLREKSEFLERDNKFLMDHITKMNTLTQKQAPPIPEVPKVYDLDDDALVEGKQYKALQKQFKEMKDTQDQYFLVQKAREEELIEEEKLKAEFPDLTHVITKQNMDSFKEGHPELFESLGLNPSFRKRAISFYKAIKNLKISSSPQPTNENLRKNPIRTRVSNSVNPQVGQKPLDSASNYMYKDEAAEREKRYRLMQQLANKR